MATEFNAKYLAIKLMQISIIGLFLYGQYSLYADSNYYSKKSKLAGFFLPPYALYVGGKELYHNATSSEQHKQIKKACLDLARDRGVVKISRNWAYVCECVANGGDVRSCNSEYINK